MLKEYFKIFSFGVFVEVLTQQNSAFCVMINYSAVVHPELMKQFPSRHAITPSISTPYASMFRVAPKLQYGSRTFTKIRQNLLIGREFQLPSGNW